MQMVSDDLIGRGVNSGMPSKASAFNKDEESGAHILTKKWQSTGRGSWGAWDTPMEGMTNQSNYALILNLES